MCGIVYHPHIYEIENFKMNKYEKMINCECRVVHTECNLNKKETKHAIKNFIDSYKT